MSENNKQTVLEKLKPQQMVFVATCFKQQPYVRPMTLIYDKERFFFATGASDAKAAQIAANPRVEICLLIKEDKYSGYIRARGKLLTISDAAVRNEIFIAAPFISHYWKESTDPGFALYQMEWNQVEYMKPGDDLSSTIPWI